MGTPELAWAAIEDYYVSEQNGHCRDVVFHREAKACFVDTFKIKYKEIMEEYMDSSVESLDRHKQAAILIYCTTSCGIFTPCRELTKDEIFVGEQQIALLLGLSFMKDRLNDILKENNQPVIEKYVFPKAYSCKTEYFDILTRDLYLQTHRDSSVYLLFLAHILFFIEYLTLCNTEIDDNILREWNSNS